MRRGVEPMLLRKYKHKKKKKKDKLVLSVILLICIGVIAIVAVYILHMDRRTIKADLYRYDTGYRFDYLSPSQLIKTEKGLVLKNGNKELLLEEAPLYYKERERVLLPMVMVAYCPSENRFGKVDYFTELYKEENEIFVQNGKHKLPLSGGFLHNGTDLYLFLEKTTVKWRDRLVVLEPFSYAVVIYNQRLELYSPQVGQCILEDTGVCKVMAETESGYSINLSTDILCRADGKEQMLFAQPSTLKELE